MPQSLQGAPVPGPGFGKASFVYTRAPGETAKPAGGPGTAVVAFNVQAYGQKVRSIDAKTVSKSLKQLDTTLGQFRRAQQVSVDALASSIATR